MTKQKSFKYLLAFCFILGGMLVCSAAKAADTGDIPIVVPNPFTTATTVTVTVLGTDSTGATQSQVLTLTLVPPVVVNPVPTASLTVNGSNSATVVGGVGTVSYVWSSTAATGGSTKMTITPGGADGCSPANTNGSVSSITGPSGSLPNLATLACQDGYTYTFTYTATGPGGSASASASVTVTSPSACGALGKACCSSGNPCTGTLTCQGGTCQTPPSSDPCNAYSDSCTDCSGAVPYDAGYSCGWCTDSGGSCETGNQSGPSSGSCSNWVWLPSECSASTPHQDACVSIVAPSSVYVGQQFSATTTMENTGSDTWKSVNVDSAQPYRLGAQDPQDNSTWGFGRVELPSNTVAPGANAVFVYTATAPSTPGTYKFDWDMLQEGVTWFQPIASDECTKQITVNAGSPPAPTISLSPSSMTFNGVSGSATPGGQTLTISNTGSATLNWTATSTGAGTWCSVSPTSGTVAVSGTPSTVTVSVNSPSNVGSFNNCSIKISDSNASNNPQTLGVAYVVIPGTVDGGPGNTVTDAQATCPAQGVVLTWTPGSGAGGYNIYRNTSNSTSTATEIQTNMSVQNGNVGNQTYTDNNSFGTYFYWVQSYNLSAGLSGIQVPASTNSTGGISPNTCSYSPTISLSPSSMTFNGVSGSATPGGQTLTISNTGSATLNWTATSTGAGTWCSVSPTSGTVAVSGTPSTVTVSVTSPSNVGTFNNCSIKISDSNASNNPQTLGVTYVVIPGPPGGGSSSNISVSAGTGAQCQTLVITWTPGSNASGYNVYRNTINVSSSATKIVSNQSPINGNIGNQTYTNYVSGGPYYYWVESTSGGVGTGTLVAASNNFSGGVSANSCSGGSGPATVTLNNTATCGQIGLSWTPISGDSYNVYRSTGSSFSGASKLNSTAIPAGTTTYTDTTATVGQPYNYWVTGVSSGGVETSPTAGSQNPVVPLACSANLGDSDKDIVSINGTAVSGASACDGYTDPLPAGAAMNAGDNIGFQINLCNDNGTATTSNITVTDTMANLQMPSAGWSAIYTDGGSSPVTLHYDGANPGSSCTPSGTNHYCAYGTSPDQTLVFNLTSSQDNIAVGAIADITYTAQLAVSGTVTQSQSRFQNSFSVYSGGTTILTGVSTPWLTFGTGKSSPTINEVP